MKMIRVIAKRDGFRRAGREWTGTAELRASEFTKEQLAALKGEPMLVVQEFEADPPAASAAGTDSGAGGQASEGGTKTKGKPKE